MKKLDPRSPGFRTIKSLIRRMEANPKTERAELVSIKDRDVPAWQRQTVWNDEEMGLLVFSVLKSYPIGMLILWKKKDGIRVPIDGRQRLTAIRRFSAGLVSIPDLPSIPLEWRNKKYKLLDDDAARGFRALSIEERDQFDDYELQVIEYEGIDEETAMEIFVMLQGGKSLTKTEVRAALGGQLCDFITDLTTDPIITSDGEDDEEEANEEGQSKHAFFKALGQNIANRRKAHRNVADILVHEHLYPGQDKHWTSLEKMYREKSRSMSDREKNGFRKSLARFHSATLVKIKGRKKLLPQLRSAHLIQTIYRAWTELTNYYDLPNTFSFAREITEFEKIRVERADELPWIKFTAALSNAGYAQNRIQERHDILMGFLLAKIPEASYKQRDKRRLFSVEQKIAIWERANHQCEWKDASGKRCIKEFDHPRKADADHIVMWKNNGPTSIDNGRLLCPKHNRARKGIEK